MQNYPTREQVSYSHTAHGWLSSVSTTAGNQGDHDQISIGGPTLLGGQFPPSARQKHSPGVPGRAAGYKAVEQALAILRGGGRASIRGEESRITNLDDLGVENLIAPTHPH